MSGRAPTVPEVSNRTRRASAKVAEQVASQVADCCDASGCACDLLAADRGGPEGWEPALVAVVGALTSLDALAKTLRAERDRLILMLSTAGPDGRPHRTQAQLSRLTGVADSWINKLVRQVVLNQHQNGGD